MWRKESSIWVEALETTSAMISFIRAQIYLLLIADLCFECWVCKAAFETVISFTASRLIKLRVLMSEKNRNKWLRREEESKAENGNNGYEEEIQQDHWKKKKEQQEILRLHSSSDLFISFYRTILEKEGMRSLFRGLGPNLVGVAPSRWVLIPKDSLRCTLLKEPPWQLLLHILKVNRIVPLCHRALPLYASIFGTFWSQL